MRSLNILLLVAALMPAPLLLAQSPTPTPKPHAAPAAVPTGVPAGDAILASWLHSTCTNEIALAGIAAKQTKNSEVRAFAQKLVDDHTAFAAKLQPFAAALEPAAAKVGDTVQPLPSDGKHPTDASASRPHATGGAFDHAGLIRELGAKCLATASKQLASKPAAEFDRCFLGMQVAAHAQAIDMLTVFRTHASPSLVATLDEGLKVYGAHHELAVALHKKLGDAANEGRGGR